MPEDLAVIAYDDEVASLADLPLTAVAPDKHAVGAAAARLLLSRLGVAEPGATDADAGVDAAGGSSFTRRHLDILPTLRVRVSCGAAVAAP